ncbi:cwf18 pre-mRNA splicing factor [Wolffia australiana]
MGAEGESAERAAEARRERLRALRAAKELLSTPDEATAAQSGVLQRSETDDRNDGELSVEEPNGKRKISDEDSAVSIELDGTKDEKELPSSPGEAMLQDGVDVDESEDAEEENKMNVKFRNYVPLDKRLQEHKLAPPSLPKFEDPVAGAAEPEKAADPFMNIAPKKPNWDLRRDVQKRLDKLERRTQKALYELYVEQEEKQALEGTDELGLQS